MHARIVAHKAICLAGVEIPAGGVFATMEFGNVLLAEFFAARLGWSWFRVELGESDVVVGTESPDTLPEVAALFAGKSAADAGALIEQLKAIGITSIATLAKADAKALRAIVGAVAGELTRAAKRKMIALRHAALLPDQIEVIGKLADIRATLSDPAPIGPVEDKPKAKPKGKKPADS